MTPDRSARGTILDAPARSVMSGTGIARPAQAWRPLLSWRPCWRGRLGRPVGPAAKPRTLTRARAEPFHVLFQVSGRAKPFRAAGAEMSRMRGSSGWGRSGVGDGRSVFHSRVGYRMNAFRRGLASDLGRASAHGLPTGLSRMSLTFRSAPGLTGQGSALKAPLAAPPDRSPR